MDRHFRQLTAEIGDWHTADNGRRVEVRTTGEDIRNCVHTHVVDVGGGIRQVGVITRREPVNHS